VVILNIGRDDLCMFAEIELKGIAGPSAHCADNVKRKTAQQPFRCAADLETVSWWDGLLCVTSRFLDTIIEDFEGQRLAFSVSGSRAPTASGGYSCEMCE
jgi:hypothetical protein